MALRARPATLNWITRAPDRAGTAAAHARVLSLPRRIAVATVAIGLVLAALFAVLELGLGRFYYSNIDELRQDEFDPELGWRLKPGTYTVKAPQSLLTHTVSINTTGLRGRELTPTRDSNTRRIVVLGDSFTFGQAVSDDALFTTRLERALNERSSSARFEVINAGVPGYGTAQELLLLRRLANAGVVGEVYVLNLFTNDILDNLRLDYATRSENAVQPGFRLDSGGHPTLAHLPQPMLREDSNLVAARPPSSSKLLSVVKLRLQSLAQTQPGLVRMARGMGFDITVPRIPGIIGAWYDTEVLEQGVPLMKALLAEIKTEVARRNGVLLVSLIPSPMQVYSDTYGEVLRASFPDDPLAKQFLGDPTRPQRLVQAMCRDLDLPLLDMYGVLSARHESFYIPLDGHFNEAGHAMFASSLDSFVSPYLARANGSPR